MCVKAGLLYLPAMPVWLASCLAVAAASVYQLYKLFSLPCNIFLIMSSGRPSATAILPQLHHHQPQDHPLARLRDE